MIKFSLRPAALLAAALAACFGAAPSQAGIRRVNAPLSGLWRNPYGTVDVRIDECGDKICGVVASATPDALADARDSGYPRLIGLELLQDYRADKPGHWVGTVLVPDLGRSFASHIELIDANHARISGCLWRQFLCKSQIWQRL
ncbi:DUF2147 domain-containing protein [Novosphingobium flavum]|uniref:DUF2147 domain-containing protein n=1 Tax=Novosphingobium flavum TaxID=1778672 RepID=A0A7X1FTR5_9SPHN|nr:DUF2147 domain-containing protein [Novosphingobium flavum]MBC2666818.1 DUF2147 domain-containing protein [Novosphingobium flavum]